MNLLSRYAPEFDRTVRHATDIRADVPTVLASITEANLGQSRIVRVFVERLCDAALLDSQRASWPRGLTLDAFQNLGCILLKSHDDREVALGAIVTMSAARLRLVPVAARTFASFAQPDSVKVLWHFYVASSEPRTSTLTLEVRVRGYGGATAGQLLRRWDTFARLGTLGRREVVAAIKADAESSRSDRSRSANFGTNRRPDRPEHQPRHPR